MKPVVVVENIRSAYNVGNIIRTADALGYDIVLSGYTAHPEEGRVSKTSLGAEEHVHIQQYWNPTEALHALQQQGYLLLALEITPTSISLETPVQERKDQHTQQLGCDLSAGNFAFVVGNERRGVLEETL
ncbi:MAG: hypothetical protein H6765_02245 [Candidatus Peribacteria bacterium]|nr:MAG: hypothetical protein H6765_02245 [Candidatus Peribacteria bacterium]